MTIRIILAMIITSMLSACGGSGSSNSGDDKAPTISLNGNAVTMLLVGEAYEELGASATDDVDGEITVVISGEVNSSAAGTYSLTYTATDNAGNSSQVSRRVTVFDSQPFVTSWKTDNSGITGENSVSFTSQQGSVDYIVDWGDGIQERVSTRNTRHFYDEPGIYTVTINGNFPGLTFVPTSNGTEDSLKLISVEQWGDIVWSNFEHAFNSCENLEVLATDAPNLSQVTSMASAFNNARTVNFDMSSWDVASVTNMDFMFQDALSFNGDVSTWDVSNVTSMQFMFIGARSFNSDVSQWDVSNVESMESMFREAFEFNQDVSTWNTSKVTNMSSLFQGTEFSGDVSQWDVSNVTSMRTMFAGSQFSGDVSLWDVSKVEDMSGMFFNLENFNSDLSQWDVSSVEAMDFLFSGAKKFDSDLALWDVSNVTNMSFMFKDSAFSGDVSSWNVSKVRNMDSMFENVVNFDGQIQNWDVSSVFSMRNMFVGTTISTEVYDSILINWSQLSLKDHVSLHMGSAKYSANAQAARDALVNNFNWTITDGGLSE